MPLSDDIARELKQSVEVRQLHGANSPTQLEWWYFTGHLWKNPQQETCGEVAPIGTRPADYAVQSTFFLSDSGIRKGLLAHAAQADLASQKHSHAELVSALTSAKGGSPLAYAEKFFLNLALGHWRLTQLGAQEEKLNWDLRFDVKGVEYLLQLDVDKNKLWFHGEKGHLKKTPSSGNFYYSVPIVPARGVRISRTLAGKMTSEPVCGQLWFDHEIHVEQVLDVGWNWFGLSFSNQKTLMFYEIISEQQRYTPRGEIWDHKRSTAGTLSEVKILAQESKCLRSGRCYPQAFSISFKNPFTGKTETVKTQAAFAEQELDGGSGALARIYWEGSTKAVWSSVSDKAGRTEKIADGLGFTELVPLVSKK
jgi:predicted secreted hydrolase